MSGRPPHIAWRAAALDRDSGLRPLLRLLVAVYAEHARRTSDVLDPAPGVPTLAAEMGVHERTAWAARRELREAGWLELQERPGRPSRARMVFPTPGRRPGPGERPVLVQPLAERQTNQGTRDPEEDSANAPSSSGRAATTKTAAPGGQVVPLPGMPPAPADVHRELTSEGVQALVARYVERVRELTDEPAPGRLVGHVARQVKALVEDGVSAPTIARALDLLVERRLNPSALASLVPEAAAGPREHAVDVHFRRAFGVRPADLNGEEA